MSGVRFALPSAETTGDTIPYPEGPGHAPKDGQFRRGNPDEKSPFAWETVTTMDLDTMRSIVQGDTPWRGIERVRSKELALIIMDLLQSDIDKSSLQSGDSDLEYRRNCVKCIRGLGKHFDIVPSVLYIEKSLVVDVENQAFGGAFSDIYRGRIVNHLQPVCVKKLRIHLKGQFRREEVNKAFCHEALILRQLCHDNIIPLYGVNSDIFPECLCLILPWIAHGNVSDYLQEHPEHDRRGWIWDIAAGIRYLHGCNPCIVHKDIRGANILVASDLRCLIADFGISLVTETQIPGPTARGAGNTRWQPPEIIDESEYDASLLQKADIYSFGCTIIEIYTGRPPFSDAPTNGAVLSKILAREPPTKPCDEVLPTMLWQKVVAGCLVANPGDRPSADFILTALLEMDETYFQDRLARRGLLPECSSIRLLAPRPAGSHLPDILKYLRRWLWLSLSSLAIRIWELLFGWYTRYTRPTTIPSSPASRTINERTSDTQSDDAKKDRMAMHATGPFYVGWAGLDLRRSYALKNIMTGDAPWRDIMSVPQTDAPSVMDKLQSELDKLSSNDFASRRKYVKCLLQLGKTYDVLPSQLYIPKHALKAKEEYASHGGGFSDVYCGEIHGHPGRVCLKMLRMYTRLQKNQPQTLDQAKKMLVLSWRQVSHDNILPFYGVSDNMFGNGILCFISPWMKNGTVLDYLDMYPDHDRRGWIWDVAAGLNYLHQLDPCIVHKEIRGENLLVGDDLRCYLMDFGLSSIAETLKPGTATRRAGHICWLPAEVIDDACKGDDTALHKVDIYSFGCTIVELYTEAPPYANLPNDAAVIEAIRRMQTPSPPPSDVLPSELWHAIVVKALSPIPEDRPSAADILAALDTLYGQQLKKYRRETRTKPLKSVLNWRTATSTACKPSVTFQE